MTEQINKSCIVCNSTFLAPVHLKGIKKYCGSRCRNKAANVRNREYKRRWMSDNKERVRESQQRYLEANPVKRKLSSELYRQNNSKYYSHKAREYYYKKRNSQPIWADSELIELIYDECPAGYEVDHIIPTNGHNVCGLHTPENFQYLPMSLNRRKSNKLNEDVNAVIHSDAFSDDRSDQ